MQKWVLPVAALVIAIVVVAAVGAAPAPVTNPLDQILTIVKDLQMSKMVSMVEGMNKGFGQVIVLLTSLNLKSDEIHGDVQSLAEQKCTWDAAWIPSYNIKNRRYMVDYQPTITLYITNYGPVDETVEYVLTELPFDKPRPLESFTPLMVPARTAKEFFWLEEFNSWAELRVRGSRNISVSAWVMIKDEDVPHCNPAEDEYCPIQEFEIPSYEFAVKC